MSKVEPWQGHKKPPFQSSGKEAWAPVWNLSEGEQPKWVQIPTATKISGLIERAWFKAYAGVSSLGLRSDLGSAKGLDFFQRLNLVRRALDDPDGLAAPLDGHFFT